MHIKTQLKLQALIVPPLLPFLHFFLAAFAVLSWLPKINYFCPVKVAKVIGKEWAWLLLEENEMLEKYKQVCSGIQIHQTG